MQIEEEQTQNYWEPSRSLRGHRVRIKRNAEKISEEKAGWWSLGQCRDPLMRSMHAKRKSSVGFQEI